MKAMPAPAQMSTRASDERSRRLQLFWTETISATFRARDSSAAETFEIPMWRILPSRWRSTRVPIESSIGTRRSTE